MGWLCAFALCLLASTSLAESVPQPVEPQLIPLNCNETDAQVGLAVDLLNDDRDEGFVLRPVRVKSVFEQQITSIAGASVYYIDVNVIETKCSVLSGKKWRDCNDDVAFHELIYGECKIIYYVSKPWRKLELLKYNCSITPAPSSAIVNLCPDCPTVHTTISDSIKEKAKVLVGEFNKQDSNQTRHFKLENIERVTSQWVFGWSYFFSLAIKETECLKTEAEVNLDDCKSLKDDKAHVGFCKASSFPTYEGDEALQVSCEIYEPRDHSNHRHHHHEHHHHGPCDQTQDNADASEAGASDKKEKSKDVKCDPKSGKSCRQEQGHKHHCHPGHHHHHQHHHHHHHHPHQDHSQPHKSSEHSSSSEESTDKKPFEFRSKGSVQLYPNYAKDSKLPTPTILRSLSVRRFPWNRVPQASDFPNEPSPLNTCPGEPVSNIPSFSESFIFQ